MIDRYTAIWKLIQVHGYLYDYRTVNDLKNENSEINYICDKHGLVSQIYHNHKQGKKCRKCSYTDRVESRRMTVDKVIEKCKEKNIDISKYDLSDVFIIVKDYKTVLCNVMCKKCGHIWSPLTITFMKGVGCPKCAGKVKTDEEVREELSRLHPELDFSQTKYSERDELNRLKVICSKHGEQLISYGNLKHGQGCYWCGREAAAKKKMMTQDEFIRRALLTHSLDDVNYSNTIFKGIKEEIEVYCKHCKKTYKQLADNHLKGCGCPECAMKNMNKSETLFYNQIKEIFSDAIHGYKNGKILGKQSIDVYIPSYNVGIEFQGEQHFEECHFGRFDSLEVNIDRDLRKIQKCEDNDIKLFHYTTFYVPNDFNLYKVYTDFDELVNQIKQIKPNE